MQSRILQGGLQITAPSNRLRCPIPLASRISSWPTAEHALSKRGRPLRVAESPVRELEGMCRLAHGHSRLVHRCQLVVRRSVGRVYREYPLKFLC